MKTSSKAGALAIAALLACPAYAHAVILSFSGVVSPGSVGTVHAYDPSVPTPPTSFDGDPVGVTISIAGPPNALYVDYFSIFWSIPPEPLPYIINWSGSGFPNAPGNENLIGFFSTVSLTNTGGSVFITPTSGFIASTDSDFNLSVNFTYGAPHDPFSTFVDNGTTGGGDFDGFKTFVIDPTIGPYDAFSQGDFTITGFSQRGLPEPATWALMLAGFGGIGAAMRARRSSLPTT
jgi:hypothetical protein